MEAWFDIQDMTENVIVPDTSDMKEVVRKGVVFFHLRKASTACPTAVPFEFDGPATEEHKKAYASQWAAFEASKPV
jgi:hypothetical protein